MAEGNGRGGGRGRGHRPLGEPLRRPGQETAPTVRSRGSDDDDPKPKRQRTDEGVASTSAVGGGGGAAGGGGNGTGRGRGRGRRQRDELVICRPDHIKDKRGTEKESDVTIVANYFKLNSTPNWILYHYHVDFDPVIESTRLKRAFVHSKKAELGTFTFDGMALFTVQRVGGKDEFELTTHRRSDDALITMKFKLVAELKPTDSRLLQVMNIQMRKIYRHMKFQQLNRYYFDPMEAQTLPRHNLEIWPGFITAIHRYENHVLLQADLAFKILRRDTVLDQLNTFRQSRPDFQDAAIRELVDCIVLTRYNNKTYKISDIDWTSTPKSTFPLKNGSTMTFEQYYKDHWNLTINNLTQPLLVTEPSTRDQNRGLQGKVLLIPELSVMTGLSEQTRGNYNTMKEIGAITRVVPEGRVNALKKFMNRMQSNAEVRSELSSWSVGFDPDLLVVRGRLLKSEKIKQGNNETFDFDRNNDWSREMRSKTLFETVAIHKWVLIFGDRCSGEANDLRTTLSRVCQPMGIQLGNPRMLNLQRDSTEDFVSAIRSNHSPELQLVVCVLPTNDKRRYDGIKKCCCVERPVPSQVVVSRTLSKRPMLMSVATKIGIQLNCKLGGAAWAVDLPMKDVMVIGYDAYRDPTRKGTAVGAVCCSLNNSLTKYHSRVTFQTSEGDMINGLVANVAAGLKRYQQLNKRFPVRIFIYRDGVSEGQLLSIRDNELHRILELFKELGIPDQKMSFVVVNKRINTRLIERVGAQHKNPSPGTVVDTEITRPEWYDFFLVSQSVRQGTVTPTHYNVIHDNTNLQPNHMQRLTYKLTHLYFNWPGTVRVPAPCLYAHKLAFLTSQSLHVEANPALADKLFFL